MRCRFAAAGVPSPAFKRWQLADDPAAIAAATRFPCVVKPTMLSGSRGVMRADDPAELAARFARLRGILAHERCDDVLVEDYIPGVEVALEGLLDGGRLRTLALFDKPDPLEGPFFEETLYVTPSRLPADAQAAIEDAAARGRRRARPARGPDPRRAALERARPVPHRGGGAVHRRAVLADAALRRRTCRWRS